MRAIKKKKEQVSRRPGKKKNMGGERLTKKIRSKGWWGGRQTSYGIQNESNGQLKKNESDGGVQNLKPWGGLKRMYQGKPTGNVKGRGRDRSAKKRGEKKKITFCERCAKK